MVLWFQLSSTAAESELPVCPSGGIQRLQLLVSLPFPNPHPHFNPSWNDGNKIMPALYLAKDQINNRTDLLPCHELELISVDGGCDISATTAVSTAVGLFNQDKSQIVGMIGPGCSASSLQTGRLINQPEIEIVHIHGGASRFLSNRIKFNNSLGILGSTRAFVELAVDLVKRNGWHNVAILFESGRVYYTSTKDDFVQELNGDQQHKVKILFESPVYSTFYPLDGVRNSLSRVVFLFTALYHTRRILCLVYHNGLFYPAYQWIIFNHRLHEIANIYSSENITFTYNRKMYTCSPATLVNFTLEGTFLINHKLSLNISNSNKPKFADTTFSEFLSLYEERAESYNVSVSIWAYYFYDAVWAWARVLHKMTVDCSAIFDEFEYGNKSIANLILEQFYASDFEFEGMSGFISFNSSNGFFARPANLYQIIGGKEIHIAYWNGTNSKITQGVSPEVISDIIRVSTSVSHGLIAIFAFLLFVWFLVLVTLHVLTILYRDTKSVKASSPKLNHFAFIGTYFLVFGLLLFLFIQVREHPSYVSGPVCHAAWVWMLPISFTLTIGTVTARTWRLYRIFNHYLDPGRFISNTALTMALFMLTSLDVIIAVIWSATDPRMLRITTSTIDNGPAKELVIIRTCRSKHDSVWLKLVLSYKASLLLVMVVLTFLTRNIPNKTFANASLRVFSYTFSTVFTLGFTLYFFFLYFASTRVRLDANVNNSVLYVTANIIILLYVCCVLGPPLVPIADGKPYTKALSQLLSKVRRSRQRKISRESVDGSEAEVRVRKTSADALL